MSNRISDRGAVHLRASGISLVIDAPTAAMPVVAYWGEDLGDLPSAALDALVAAQHPPVEKDPTDASVRPGIIPLASDGWMGRPGLVGRRPGGTSWAPQLRLRDVVVGGSGDDADAGSAGSGGMTLRLVDDETLLDVDVTIDLLPQGVLRCRAVIVNAGSDDYELDELGIVLPVPLGAGEILDFAGRWGREREPQRQPVTVGCHLREGRRGRTGFDAPLMMFCGEPGFGFASGRVWGVHVAHSGNHRTWLERTNTGRQVMGGGELLLPGEVVLGPGDSYRSPWIYAQHADGLDDAAHRLHAWERTLPSHPGRDGPVTLNVWEAVYFNHDLDVLRALADRAASIGVERFVLDDGWFLGRRDERRALGDWYVDDQVWPEGLHPLVDHVRGFGMEFGLWIEPEMVSSESELAKAHPEWILRARGDLPLEKRFQQVLNLTIPDAWEHVRSRLDALIEEYRIDYLKWDHNRDLVDAGDGRRGGRAAVREQTLACYRLMDRLRADHPGLQIEACSSGGGRVDLEMVRHAQRFWISDCIDPHERQSILRWSAQVLAPELMGAHVASARSHTTGRVSDLSFRAGTALWGHMGFELDLLDVGEAGLAALAEWVSLYRANRDLLLGGRIIRREAAAGALWLHGVVAPDGGRALYQLASRTHPPMSPLGAVPLPGLEAGRRYRVRPVLIGDGPAGLVLPPWGARETLLDGRVLGLSGIQAPILFPDQVLVIEVEEAEGAW